MYLHAFPVLQLRELAPEQLSEQDLEVAGFGEGHRLFGATAPVKEFLQTTDRVWEPLVP
jgi:hypothetical protein